MRRFRKCRYPLAHVAGFLDRCAWEGDCLVWQGTRSKKGYGKVSVNGKQIDAHRHAWSFINGPIPDGMFVLHRCDNPPCVLGKHLFLGTHQDNMRDMSRKGRRSWAGQQNPHCKLSDVQVAEIKQRYRRGNGLRLAAEYGVTSGTISNIVTGKTGRYANSHTPTR